ncbi:TorF family putative porin [Thiohalobacter sp. IOR34]|uniref:TorF family putative porin n=1 Tax=Thiohalobacter sp. IOR34 TaxID=3057176 RepID=UPI0025B02EE5|nr:TorF family putative porin [Thiohalobacter sp. IOR34]WJW75657.1 TorF family putative porin [Thiohalobacter sp. IOR34]
MNTFAKAGVAVAMAALSASAAAEISGNVALATDYMFRGVSQTDNQMALQGGFDWAHESGFYIGAWASNVDSNFFSGTSTDPQLEADLYLGYAGEVGEFGYDLGVIRYSYPGYDDANTTEVYLTGSYSFFSAGVYYSNELNFVGVSESAWYIDLGAEYEVAEGVTVAAHVGFSDGDAYDSVASGGLGSDYMDYSIGVSTEMAGVGLDLTYVGTNNDGEDIFGGVADDRVVFTVSKSF